MVVRLGGAICVAAITFACSSYSVSSNGIEKEITPRPVASGRGIVGVASSYNPYRKDYWSGDIETASVSGMIRLMDCRDPYFISHRLRLFRRSTRWEASGYCSQFAKGCSRWDPC